MCTQPLLADNSHRQVHFHSPTKLSLTGNAAAAPNFTINASPTSSTVKHGANGTITITITSANTFQCCDYACATALPTGITAGFSSNPVTAPANGSATSTLTLTPSATLGPPP
jgi:hypothetical protein